MPVLDTDLLITYLRKSPKKPSIETQKRKEQSIKVIESLFNDIPEDGRLITTIFNVGELHVGVNQVTNKVEALMEINEFFDHCTILPFTLEDSFEFGKIKSHLYEIGKFCGDLDILIASIVINHDETLYTNNIDHFINIPEIKLKDWML